MVKKVIFAVMAILFAWGGLVGAVDSGAEPVPNLNDPGLDIAGVMDQPPRSPDSVLTGILKKVRHNHPGALREYCQWIADTGDAGRIAALKAGAASGTEPEPGLREQLDYFAGLVLDARDYAASALANRTYRKEHFHDLIVKALDRDSDDHALAVEAVGLVSLAWCEADGLVKARDNLFLHYTDELRRGKVADGTRLAWSLIRVGAGHPDTRIRPGSFRYDNDRAEIKLTHLGADFSIAMDATDYGKFVKAEADGYRFRSGWPVLFQKPLGWMATIVRDMRDSGVPADGTVWEVMEAPGGLIALDSGDGTLWRRPEKVFYQGALRPVAAIPLPDDARDLTADFVAAAKALHEGVMNDTDIPNDLRRALEPVLAGTYLPIDPRDYFNSQFCRRLIEAEYLETVVPSLSVERRSELEAYRAALALVENGVDYFAVDLGDDGRLVAVLSPSVDTDKDGADAIQDQETGESVSRYTWRLEGPDYTEFHSPLTGRGLYAFSLVERYPGSHAARPAGVPELTEVWHAVLGDVASYRDGDRAASGDASRWLEAVTLDARGRRDSTSGPLGWNFPLFVPVRDDQGDPVAIATLNGVVPSPDFTAVPDEAERRRAQDEWLDHAAAVLAHPGEMNLIYQVFFRYCSDSPLPEQPNLIGSHYGLSDTHQTVYESMDRRWAGRLIGDCDDVAEFFQVLATRQGRLAHVMQVPSHAAAGFLEESPDGGYEFIVLQSGPVLRFAADNREQAVENAYRHFDSSEGDSQFTLAAVPVLLRFGGDETRTPFVLSARIYWDRDYAEEMIRVQEYWHLDTYSAAARVMEEMIKTDREIGNLKELASLYERMGEYDKSAALRREELAAVADSPLESLSTRLSMAQMYVAAKDTPNALTILEEMAGQLVDFRENCPALYRRAAAYRSSWAMLLAKLGEPGRAWELIRYDVEESLRNGGRHSDLLLRTLVSLYDRMSVDRDSQGALAHDRDRVRDRYAVRSALSRMFGDGYFSEDDSYNKLHLRYYWLGRYAVAVAGRSVGLASLWLDGPYPEEPWKFSPRQDDITEADWRWFRIMPRLYLALGLEMLNRDEYPELYDPVGARHTLELVARAARKGENYGSAVMGRDAILRAELVLSFIRRDLPAFRRVMAEVRSMDYALVYGDAASTFGMYCGLVPITDFDEWIDAFREYFPGRQYYFKAAYRAMDKEHFDHAERLAERTAVFFRDDDLFVREAESLRRSVAALRRRQLERGWDERDWAALPDTVLEPAAATWLREMVEMVK